MMLSVQFIHRNGGKMALLRPNLADIGTFYNPLCFGSKDHIVINTNPCTLSPTSTYHGGLPSLRMLVRVDSRRYEGDMEHQQNTPPSLLIPSKCLIARGLII